MKHEWRKKEKQLYIPTSKPQIISVPTCNFLTISGQGSPDSTYFSDCITALYTASYGIKMYLKKQHNVVDYIDYTVYPLEGIWDLTEEGRKRLELNATFDKNQLVYTLMIRQPSFLTKDLALTILNQVKIKKKIPLLAHLNFETIEEGKCIQMLHIGSFDSEPASFKIMEDFMETCGLQRISKTHKEIYLSDFRKVPENKLKTVLRFKVR